MTRVPIGPDTLAAAYRAHMADAHAGQIGRGTRGGVCPVCRRYAAALTLARADTVLIDPNPRARHVPGIGRVVEPPITGPPQGRP